MTGTDDKITPLPTLLERIGQRIENGWRRTCNSGTEWVEGSLEVAQALAEGRTRFPSDIEFGTWLKTDGHDHWNEHDRAALIGLGSDLTLAREVLVQTDRRSYKHIWLESKSRFVHVDKPRRKSGQKQHNQRTAAPKPHYKEADIAALFDKGLTNEQIAKLTDIGKRQIRHVTERVRIKREGIAEGKAVEDAALTRAEDKFSEKSKLTLADAIRIHKARLDKTFMTKLGEEVRRRIVAADDAMRKENATLRKENLRVTMLLQQRVIFTPEEFKTILRCLHPDNSASPAVRAQAFDLFKQKEERLTGVVKRK